MTVVEKAAYLKGLLEGLDVSSDSKEGKLWNCVSELLSDMAHEVENLNARCSEYEDELDDLADQIEDLEEEFFDLDEDDDEDFFDDDDDDDDDESYEKIYGDFLDENGELYDGLFYDVTCPICGEKVTFKDKALEEGSVICPNCGEKLEFAKDDKK